MTMPLSGKITLNDASVEIMRTDADPTNGTGTTRRLSEYTTRDLFEKPSSVIKLSDGYGKEAVFKFSITTNQVNLDLRAYALSRGWNGHSKLEVTINSGVYIYASSTSNYAMTITGTYSNDVAIINYGSIIGRGGNGGGGGGAFESVEGSYPGTSGAVGGPALLVQAPVRFTNYGTIAGGGGGGGGGGGYNDEGGFYGTEVYSGGGGGGGGAGYGAGGGAGGSDYTGPGSPGGGASLLSPGAGGGTTSASIASTSQYGGTLPRTGRQAGSWCQWICDYGIWHASGADYGQSVWTTYVPVSAYYTVRLSADNEAAVFVDGAQALYKAGFWDYSEHSIWIDQGIRTITVNANNWGGPRAVAAMITSGAGVQIWSTLDQLYTSVTYTSGQGGSGGYGGQLGQAGGAGAYGTQAGGSGGSGGPSVVGNSNVTWLSAGNRYGALV